MARFSAGGRRLALFYTLAFSAGSVAAQNATPHYPGGSPPGGPGGRPLHALTP